jgi:hypothetical protein
MVWQDIIIAIVQVVLTLSLVPQIYMSFKKRKGHITLQTSVPTTIGIYVLSVCYFTLGLYLSCIIGAIMATLWLVLLLQKIVYK